MVRHRITSFQLLRRRPVMYGRIAGETSALDRNRHRPARQAVPRPAPAPVTRRGAAQRESPPSRAGGAYRPAPGSWHDDSPNQTRCAMSTNGMPLSGMTVNGIELEVLRRGSGTPVLLLHGMDTVHPQARFLDLLDRDAEIIAPSSPGFGNTKRPADFDTIYDLVRLYLAVLDELPYERIALLGLSFGGW